MATNKKTDAELKRQIDRLNSMLKSVDEGLSISPEKIAIKHGKDQTEQIKALKNVTSPEMAVRYSKELDERTGAIYSEAEHTGVRHVKIADDEIRKGRTGHGGNGHGNPQNLVAGRKKGAKDKKPRHVAPQEVRNQFEKIKTFITEDYKIHIDDVASASKILDDILNSLINDYGQSGVYRAMENIETTVDTFIPNHADSYDYLNRTATVINDIKDFIEELVVELTGDTLNETVEIELNNLIGDGINQEPY